MTHHDQGVTFETIQRDGYNLTYTCFLLPSDPVCELTGDLPDQLAEWLQEICLLNNWKLEFVSINPQYLQWVVSVSPAVATGQIMQQVRTQTTQRITTSLGVDFWAPGYLTLQGAHLHAGPLIEHYMQLMRKSL